MIKAGCVLDAYSNKNETIHETMSREKFYEVKK